ncbi:MAG: tetratricopeptide repeat protein, partial [Bacteroidota bacterium]
MILLLKTQFQMRRFTYSIIFLFASGYLSYAQSFFTTLEIDSTGNKSFIVAEKLFQSKKYNDAIPYYEQARALKHVDSIIILLRIAKAYSHLDNPKKASIFLDNYLKSDFRLDMFNDQDFAKISHSSEFNRLKKKYLPRMTSKAGIFLFIAFLSFFLAFMLLLKETKSGTKGIIITFLILHAIFLVQGVLMLTNLRFQFPHIFLISASFSYLYGPLIYLYFKKTTQEGPFVKWELIHFIPFLIYLIYKSPVYLSS